MVSLYWDDDDDDDDDCVITDNDITGGYWMIGSDPATDAGGVKTAEVVKTLPHKIQAWQYFYGEWHNDPLLTVTGNIIILRSLY